MSAPIDMTEAVSQAVEATKAEQMAQLEASQAPLAPGAAETVQFDQAVDRALQTTASQTSGPGPLSQMFSMAAEIQNDLSGARENFSELMEESRAGGLSESELAAQFDEPTRKMLQAMRDMGQRGIETQQKLGAYTLEFQADMVKASWFRTVVSNLISSVKGLVDQA